MDQLKLIRILIPIGALGLFVGGYTLDLSRGYIVPERYIVLSLFGLCWLGTFYCGWVKRHLDLSAVVISTAAIMLVANRLIESQVAAQSAATSLIVVLYGCLLIRSTIHMVVWGSICALLMAVTTMYVDQPHIMPKILVTFSLVIASAVGSTIIFLNKTLNLLAVAQEDAEKAIVVRTQFLANMSHEIRTPINGVIGMTSLLGGTQLNREQENYVDIIRSSGEALLVIINEILNFAKIDADEIKLESAPFNLEHCVADAIDVVAPLAAAKGLELVLDIVPNAVGTVYADVTRLRQVLINLLANAVKFTAHGEVVLRVRVQPPAQSQQDATIKFEVIDTGIGIAQDNIEKLFEPFTQADASTTRRFGGTGLGLSICKNLVGLMGSSLSVTSVEGEGSNFSFPISTKWEAYDWPDRERLEGCRVLIIDDNATNLNTLDGMLRPSKIEADLCVRPTDVVKTYQDGIYNFIIIDVGMPDLDGRKLLKNLQDDHPNLPPVILLTSLDCVGFDWTEHERVLRKPVRPTDLFGLMSKDFEQQADSQEENDFEGHQQFSGTRVLIADDNPVNQVVARQILNKLGVQSDVVSDGTDVLVMLAKNSYRLVFMDLQMPTMDGLEATRVIRRQNVQDPPYIIAMTANATSQDKEQCQLAGMDDFLAKPARIEDFRKVLQRALGDGEATALIDFARHFALVYFYLTTDEAWPRESDSGI